MSEATSINIRFDAIKGAPYVLSTAQEVVNEDDGDTTLLLTAHRRGRARGYTLAMGLAEDQSECSSDEAAFTLYIRRQTRIQAMRPVDLTTMFVKAETALNGVLLEAGSADIYAFSGVSITEQGTAKEDDEKGIAIDAYLIVLPYFVEEVEAVLNEEDVAAGAAAVEAAYAEVAADHEMEVAAGVA